jgi:hypothetical protein
MPMPARAANRAVAHAQVADADAADQLGVVDGLQPRPRHGLRLVQLVLAHRPVGDDPLAQQVVLVDREVVRLRQREAPPVVRPDVHHS